MASNDNNNGKEKKEVMQSNLPLLFANGSPISLESMNLVSTYMSNLDNRRRPAEEVLWQILIFFILIFQMELQGFFLFLLKCECGRPIQGLTDIDQPSWWPSEVIFEDDLLKKASKKGVKIAR
mgnify:FL=1